MIHCVINCITWVTENLMCYQKKSPKKSTTMCYKITTCMHMDYTTLSLFHAVALSIMASGSSVL